MWNLTDIQTTTLTVDGTNPEPSRPATVDNTGLFYLNNTATDSIHTTLSVRRVRCVKVTGSCVIIIVETWVTMAAFRNTMAHVEFDRYTNYNINSG